MKRFLLFFLPLMVFVLLTAAARGIAEESGTTASAPQVENRQLPLHSVTLYSTGVGYFEHRGTVTGNETLRFSFRRQDMKDILKSLVVRDLTGGTVDAVVYEARTPLEEKLNELPVRPDTLSSLADLLRRARGEQVSVTADRKYSGRILSVEERQNGENQEQEAILSLYGSDGRIYSLPLGDISDLRFSDERFAALLEEGLQELAAGRNRELRTVEIRFRGDGSRRVRIGYVRETPVWKSSYRLEIEGESTLRLQGWAAAENTGRIPWEEVRLSFISGNPISFVMDLYSPIFLDRPELAPPSALLPSAPLYEEGYSAAKEAETAVPEPARRRSADGFGGGPAAAQSLAERPAQRNGRTASRATGEAAGSLFSYRLDDPVSVPAGSSALLPIISSEIKGEPLAVLPLNADGTRPYSSLRLTNTTGLHLAAGPVTVLEEGMYAGDARIGELAPGASRLISYAVDLEAQVVREQDSLPSEIAELRIKGGTLVYTSRERRLTRYRLVNSSQSEKRFLVEHPVSSGGWELSSPEEGVQRSPSAYRLSREVPGRSAPGKPSTRILEVIEERPREQQYALANADPERIRYFLRGAEPSEQVQEALERVAGLQAQIRALQRELSTLENRISDIHREQKRIRANMEALAEDAELYRRYVKELTAQEDQLGNLEQRRSSLREELRGVRDRLDNYLQGLEV
jgi:prefoldin subunit 5